MSLRFAHFSQNQLNLLKGVARPNLRRAEIALQRDIKAGEPDPSITQGVYTTPLPQQALSSAISTARYGEGQALHQAADNIQSAQSILKSLSTIYEKVQTKLDRMQELADIDTTAMSQIDRSLIDIEYQSVKEDIQDLVNNNPFDGKYYIGIQNTSPPPDLVTSQLDNISLIATRVQRDLVSRKINHDQLNGASANGVTSNVGRFFAFDSTATNATPGDTNGQRDVFVKNRWNGKIFNITAKGVGGDSFGPSISANGRYIVFLSDATGLVAKTTPGQRNAYLYDRDTRKITLVSANKFGVEANADTTSVTISGNSKFIGFTTAADNLMPHKTDSNNLSDAFIKNRINQNVRRVSVGTGGIEGNGSSDAIALSYDGKQIAFVSRSTNLKSTDRTAFRDVYSYNTATNTTRHISQSTLGTGSDGDASLKSLAITNNGQYVLYASEATNLHANDVNGAIKDIFLNNYSTTNIISHAVGSQNSANATSSNASMRANGNDIVFNSVATNLIGKDTNGHSDVFVYKTATKRVNRISSAYNYDLGTNIPANSVNPHMSHNGKFITYQGAENALYPNDTNGVSDIFIHNYKSAIAASRFFENQEIAFDFLYTSKSDLPITSITYQLTSITGGAQTPHNVSGTLTAVKSGVTKRVRGNADFDVSLPAGTKGNFVDITMEVTVNNIPHTVKFKPFQVGLLKENQKLEAISIDVGQMPPSLKRTVSHENVLSGTSILNEDRMHFTSFHLNNDSLDPGFTNSHLATKEQQELARNMLKDVIAYVDEGAAHINAALSGFDHGKHLNNFVGSQEALSSETYYRYNIPDIDHYEGEALLYDDISIDQSVNYALSVSNYIENILDMINDKTATYDPQNSRTGLYKDITDNPLLKAWEEAYENA